MQPLKINFSYNWNNKLDCNAFTTIRVFNETIHKISTPVEITLNQTHVSYGMLINLRKFYLKDLSEFVAYLDTGYSMDETKEIIRKMYSKQNPDQLLFVLLLIKKEKKQS